MNININLTHLVDFLAALLGPTAEVVLHDLESPEHSVVYLRNSHITHRQLGAPLTDLALKMMKETDEQSQPYQVNYTATKSNGTRLRASSLLIKNAHGLPTHMLCINIDDSYYREALNALQQLFPEPCPTDSQETLAPSVQEIENQALADVLKGKVVAAMSMEDKAHIIAELDEMGMFLIRGFRAKAARALGISEQTLYRYIKQNELDTKLV